MPTNPEDKAIGNAILATLFAFGVTSRNDVARLLHDALGQLRLAREIAERPERETADRP